MKFPLFLPDSGSGLDEIMTAEEKEKLYTAIGYSGSSHNLTLPKQVNGEKILVYLPKN